MLRIGILVVAPGRPSVWRVFKPAILPTSAPEAVEATERLMSSEPTAVTAPVSVAFFCYRPKPVTTTSSSACESSRKVIIKVDFPLTETDCVT